MVIEKTTVGEILKDNGYEGWMVVFMIKKGKVNIFCGLAESSLTKRFRGLRSGKGPIEDYAKPLTMEEWKNHTVDVYIKPNKDRRFLNKKELFAFRDSLIEKEKPMHQGPINPGIEAIKEARRIILENLKIENYENDIL
jgi:hypothetical protein